MKKLISLSLFVLLGFVATVSCSIDDSNLGGCTKGCGVVGLTSYKLTEYKFISKEDCKKKKDEGQKSCRVVYCPPTGNNEDCVEF